MSLDYSYANVKNSDEVMWDENDQMKPEIQSIIFATIPVGISFIKDEETAVKFFTRYVSWNIANKYGDPFFTLADVRSMIGLSTNSSNKTDAAFNKDLLSAIERQVGYFLEQQL